MEIRKSVNAPHRSSQYLGGTVRESIRSLASTLLKVGMGCEEKNPGSDFSAAHLPVSKKEGYFSEFQGIWASLHFLSASR